MKFRRSQLSVVSCQLSVVSCQLSVVSGESWILYATDVHLTLSDFTLSRFFISLHYDFHPR